MGISSIKKELRVLDKEALIALIATLYKKNTSARDYLDFYFHPNEQALYLRYQEKVFHAFYPKRGDRYSLKEGKQALREFAKLGPSPALKAELMLFYVETGVDFTNDFGDINQSFYASLESVFLAALKLMQKEDLLGRFAKRAGEVVGATAGIGWGFHDCLAQAYADFYAGELSDPEEDMS
ncbi:DUF6155 family protein [Cesiribacter andamanensis]|uniref:Uncharacterized protein n=1 Tax=Cesiribacter andamanensis AMV16 TaxID=1279009 RepID=M7N515_9BACT|nr:DUF6155 family protein [Cesiribacter andamanensis]EMR02296.1 hypothetical protein ADICEAN_02568 [Cesiribacter andamanensis AMV16]